MKFENALGEPYSPISWLTFNDVLLKPHKSRFKSRNDKGISLETSIFPSVSLKVPIISSNMDTVTGSNMAQEMCRLGGLGILHRFHECYEDYYSMIDDVYSTCGRVAFSVGCGDDWFRFSEHAISMVGEENAIICLDVAHGHMEQSVEMVQRLKHLNVSVIAGNVATPDGAVELAAAGAKCIKVGVGCGSVCTTRIVTGHGVPQLSAIINARKDLDALGFEDVSIIADGGIRNSGDIIKSLAAGAQAVMLGSMLAGCDETPGEIFTLAKGPFKMYRGQSSRHFLKDIGKIDVAAEGESIEVEAKGPVNAIVTELLGGVRSGFTYSGAGSIKELQEKAVFIEISHHGWVESTPHAITRVH
jgi:IMP dehydrogenase